MNCENYRQQIMDFVYAEGPEPPELKEHLQTCEECAAFYTRLRAAQEFLGEWSFDESGFREVRTALRKAGESREKVRLVYDLVKFVFLVSCVFSLFFLLYSWQGIERVALTYLAVYLLCPLLLIPLYKLQRAKEDGK